MYSYKRVMAGIDFSPMDKVIIRYISFIGRLVKPEKIYFINFQKSLDVPEGIREKYPELNRPLDEKFKEQMEKEVRSNFKDHENYDIEYNVKEGVPIEEMLRWGHIKNIDLLAAGRKSIHEGSGDLPKRMARKGRCSVLFIPQTAKERLESIFVPVDFSENSRLALEEAWHLAEKAGTAKIYCHHAYQLPIGYYSTGKTEAEFAQIMQDHAVNKYKDLLRQLNIPDSRIEPIFELQGKSSVAAMVSNAAHDKKASLVIVGAKGRTNATAILLGSVTEKLITECEDIPLLVVKQKDKSFSFYDFIKNI